VIKIEKDGKEIDSTAAAERSSVILGTTRKYRERRGRRAGLLGNQAECQNAPGFEGQAGAPQEGETFSPNPQSEQSGTGATGRSSARLIVKIKFLTKYGQEWKWSRPVRCTVARQGATADYAKFVFGLQSPRDRQGRRAGASGYFDDNWGESRPPQDGYAVGG
jgi:hypothetical protein